MKKLLFLSIIIVSLSAVSATAQFVTADGIGVYFDQTDPESGYIATSGPFEPVTAYLLLTNPSSSHFFDGEYRAVSGWECMVTVGGNPVAEVWELAGQQPLNIKMAPEFVVGVGIEELALPISANDAVLLATYTCYITEVASEVAFRVDPLIGSSFDPVAPGYAAAHDSGVLIPLTPNAPATINTTLANSPTDGSAVPVTSTQIDLSWTDNSDDESGFVIYRTFHDEGIGWEITELDTFTVGVDVASYSDIDCLPNSEYNYRIFSQKTIGAEEFNSAQYTIGMATAMEGPTAPSDLVVTAQSATELLLTWTDNSSNEDLFRISRHTFPTGTFVDIATVGVDATSYLDSGLEAGETYYYRVVASNAIGDSEYIQSNGTTFSPPTQPTNLNLTPVSNSQIDLGWTDNSSDENGFRIYRGISAGDMPLLAEVATDVVAYSDTGLSPHTEYFYKVASFNVYGESESGTISASTLNSNPTIDLSGLSVVFDEDDSAIVDFAGYINDNDGDTLILTATNSTNIFAAIDGFSVTFTATENWSGSEELTFTVDDQQGRAVASDVTTVAVSPVNDAPTIDLTSLTIEFAEDGNTTIDFTSYVEDIDSSGLTITASTGTEITADVTDMTILFTATENWSGSETFTITVGDGQYEASDDVVVTVSAENDVPTIVLPDSFSFNEDEDLVEDFTSYLNDIDGDDLILIATNSANIFAAIDGFSVTFTATENWFGTEELTFTVNDQQGRAIASDTISINVISQDDGIEVTELLPAEFVQEIIELDTINFSITATDPEGNPLEYLWQLDGADVSTTQTYDFITDYESEGNYNVTLNVTDNFTRNTLDYSWDVTVAKNNRAPTADDLVATVNEDESVAITLSGSDPDEDVLTFSVVDSPAHGDFAGGIYTPDADYFGPDQFTYIANDGDLDSDPASVTITVTAVNDAPVIDLSTATITFTQNTTTTVDFASYVSDVDSGGLILTAEGNLDITVSIEGLSVLFGTVDSEFTGSEEVTFTVTDGQYPVSDAITITVNGLADVPATPTNLALTLAGSDAIDLSWTDSSINEDVFRIYRGTASGNLTLLVEVAANSTSYSDIGLAPHTEYFYNISAYNTYGESGMSGEQSESTPNTDPVIDLEALSVVFDEDGSTIVDFEGYINDDDGDELIITATNSANIFAEIDVFNVTFTATENWNGSEELTFTVNDQQGRAVASDVTTVVVDPVNDAPTIDLASLSVSFTQGTTIDVDFAEYVEDIDLDVLTLSASGNDHITTEINELVVTFGTANPEFTGFENIVFTVFDGEFEDQETTTVTVNALASVPAPPSDLALTVLGADEISLLWVDNSINEDGFRIYRSLEDDNYSLLAEVSANETSYTDSGLTQNTTYYYYVTAYNSYGENDPQEAQSATTLNPVPTITSIEDVPSDEGGFVTVNFNRSVMDTGDGIDESYSIEIFTDESWTEVGNEPAVGDDTYSVIVMLPETGTISEPISFQFRVMAVMDEGSYLSEEMSGYAIDNLAPAVDLLTAVSTQQGVVLEWSAVIVPDLQHFVITRREFGGDMVEIGTSMTVSYLDADPEATPGEQYFYSVYGVDIHANVGDPAEEAQVSFPQPTLLSNFTAEATGAGVEIAWELSGIDQGVSFIVKRSDAGADNYVVIDTPVVQLSELVFTVSDSSVQPAESYSYKIDFENDTGSWLLFETGVVQMPEMSYALHQNSPNPFNPLTTISYDLNKASAVRLTVYDIAGRAVRHLVDSPGESAGRHQVKWFGCDDSGHQVTSGVYFYVIQAGEFKQSKRMLLLK